MGKEIINIKEKFIKNKQNFVEQFRQEFTNLIELIEKFEPYEIFSHLNTFLKMTSLNIRTEYDVNGPSVELKYTIELIQMIITCISEKEFKKEKMQEEDVYKLMTISSEIYNLKLQYIMAYTYEIYDEKSEISEYIFESAINSEITGKRYDIFELEHYLEIFSPLRNYFEDTYKFSLDQLIEGIDNLKKKFMFGLNDSRDKMLEIMSKGNPECLTDGDKEQFYLSMDEMFGLKLQNVAEVTKWPIEFMNILSYNIGESSFPINDVSFEKLYNLHKEINKKPLIRLNNGYYHLSIHRLLDNLDRIILKDLYKKNKDNIELIKKKVASTCEELVGKYIKNIIPSSEVLISNYYKSNKKICENDILITFDKYLFIIEVKSGSFTPDVAINNIDSHFDSLKKLVEEADSQTNRFMEELENKRKLDIYESNNKQSHKKKTINVDDYKEVFKIAITLEGFNEIEARADKVGILNLNKDIIVCSLDDLKVYSDYFKNNPTQFLHYMVYRRMATHTKGINLNDELDHLGLYIEHNCYPMTANHLMNGKRKINHILFEGVREKLDLYYNRSYIGREYVVDKPVQEIPPRLNQIIEYSNNNPDLGLITCIGYLLDMSGIEKEKLFSNIEMCINHYINTKRIKYACISNCPENLLVLCCIIDNNFDIKIAYDDVYANMKITKSNQANIFFLFYDETKTLIKIKNILLTSEDERYLSTEIDEIVEKIKENRFDKRKKQNGKTKIGRNELCPCGSGIKYKKCCGK